MAAFHRTETLQPDTPYALSAASILHPNMPRQPLPLFVPSSPQPDVKTVDALRRRALGRDVVAHYYGLALQRLGRPVSAERAFAAAAAIAPNDPEALAAAAVGRFSKDNPARFRASFWPSLVKRFPRAAVIRFHLGYLLVWIGERKQAAKELKLARADAPGSVYARYSTTLLAALGHGTR